MKQYTTPLLLQDDNAILLEKVSLNAGLYNENWIQQVCFENPSLLPIEEIEPTFGGMIPICRELSTPSGFVDLLYLNEYGFLTIGECKLWRNPEARRKVIGQILDYAKDIAKWNYSNLEQACLKTRRDNGKSLFEIIQAYYPDIEEAEFIDRVQSNLAKGRFLLTIIGDGIRENMEDLANYIHSNGNMNFTLSLIELPVYKNPENDTLLITPRIIAKTKEIERIIYKQVDENVHDIEHEIKEKSQTISEQVFFERLEDSIGKEKAKELLNFLETLKVELNIQRVLGRGKRLSLNLKSFNDTYNFASIQQDGDVWFYGIVTKTNQIGNRKIGVNYLESLANIVNGELIDTYKDWHWCVKRNDQFINIIEYLSVKDEWKELLSRTLNEIDELENN